MQDLCRAVRNKEHQIAVSKREIRLRTRANKALTKRRQRIQVDGVPYRGIKRHREKHFLLAPQYLDICTKTEETLSFFSKVVDEINICKYGDILFFDLSQVEYIAPDAVMYLIAIIKNTKRVCRLRLSCCGNFPLDKDAKKMIEDVGFYSYVRRYDGKITESNSSFAKVMSGEDANGELAGRFCDFVQQYCNCGMLGTKRLYPMIIELMTNTHQHAYKNTEKEIMNSNWYIFARHIGDAIELVFLDTGAGIPATVRKKFFERIRGLNLTNDASLLKSVLQGDFRTETRQKNRGKGIPGIYENACDGAIKELCIVSGEGKCCVQDKIIISDNLCSKLNGTIFLWKMNGKEHTASDCN